MIQLDRPHRSKFAQIARVVGPLLLAFLSIEVGAVSLRLGFEQYLSLGEIVCGLAIIIVIASRALLRR